MREINFKPKALVICVAILVASCGGGSGSSSSTSGNPSTGTANPMAPDNTGSTGTGNGGNNGNGATVDNNPIIIITPNEPALVPPTKEAASRFLHFSNMGVNEKDINHLVDIGYTKWLNEQFLLPQTSHRAYIESLIPTLAAGQNPSQNWFFETFWKNAATADDQLRQRVNWALSQMFVISFVNDSLEGRIRGVANYYDILGQHSFGNFRDLLYDVSMSPMMGLYLSHLQNQKEDTKTGRVPDENYAREVMQLFTIGLYQLNLDGTIQKDANGTPLYTYTNEDVAGLAKVFTGLSWGGTSTFYNSTDPDSDVLPMKLYPNFQSSSTKNFLGKTVGTSSNTVSDAVDILFNHPNVGPFISKQLIQHLVSSNPSPQYVERVAKIFNANQNNVRGDMKSVIMAILTDPEAMNPRATSGKLKEPVVRVANFLRATEAKSATGRFLITNTEDATFNFGQSPMRSPSVFNFYRPGYVPPQSKIEAFGGVAPEFGIVDENSVAGYANTLQSVINSGIGTSDSTTKLRDVQPDYSALLALAGNPTALVEQLNLLLVSNRMQPSTKLIIQSSVETIPYTTDANKLKRVKQAVYLTMVSSDYLIQQ